MVVLREMRRRARFLVGPVLAIAVSGYFAYNFVEGDRGMLAWFRLTQELRLAKANLGTVQQERAVLDRKVNNMRPEHVDPDLLDQEVRSRLDLAAPNEIIVIRPGDRPGDRR
jgi:cell division protein FtsB